MDFPSWCALTDEQLVQRDLAVVNLEAACGLPPTGELDVRAFCRKLDQWADEADQKIKKSWKRRLRGEYSEFTGSQFRMLVLVTVLQRDLGVKYNRRFSEGAYDGVDSRDHFIHGILTGHGGTCVTMPVLYAAIGRRLGFPIKLALAKQHAFCRWDDGNGERFNIEATSHGLNLRSDEHFLRWRAPIQPEELEGNPLLRNLTPREELAFFLHERAVCWTENLQTGPALVALYFAMQLAPCDIYRMKWRFTLLMHGLWQRIQQDPALSAMDDPLCTFQPSNDEEAQFLPHVREQLNRIHANRRPAQAPLATDLSFETFVSPGS